MKTKTKSSSSRPRRRGSSEPRPPKSKAPFVPRVSRHLKPILKKIGAPEDVVFTPDPFQTEAIAKLKQGDVVVSAPTGSGKTYIAVEAMAEILAKGGRAWYASPLKALSNSKFHEFGRRFGPDRVGLLTGDHKVNADASLIVGTTEILRNQLYDTMSQGQDLPADLVVMDEAHYLGDPDRGVVWEEVIIYLPVRVRLLLLSATVANAGEIADWLTFVRGKKAVPVITHDRPVPLHPLFLFPDGELVSLSKGQALSPQVRRFIQQNPARGRRGPRARTPFGRILKTLGEANLLPAIFFLKSRADCDLALSRCFRAGDYLDPERRTRLETRLSEYLDRYPFLKTHAHLKYLRGAGLAAHHAGHMPHWKLLVEGLMQEGLLAAIFSTSTVAAGVNFPARTVVICQSDRFNGREFLDLSATDLLQMTGRAGRRGMDKIGFALVVPGPFQKPQLIHALFGASPDPVISQIQINFSMVLNLLESQRPPEIKRLLSLSLAAFQQGRSRRAKEIERLISRLAGLLDGGACETPDQALILSRRRRNLDKEAHGLDQARPKLTWQRILRVGLTPGRLFEVKTGRRHCVLDNKDKYGRPGVLAAEVRTDLGLKKGQVRRKWVPLDRIAALLDTRLDLGPEIKPKQAVGLIRDAAQHDHEVLDSERLDHAQEDDPLAALEAKTAEIKAELDRLPCRDCALYPDCLGDPNGEIVRLLVKLERLEKGNQVSGRVIWSSFLRRLEFLRVEGFVGPNDELTQDGEWAARLRLDHPLLIAAGIRAGVWPEGNPALLAGLVAPFVVDKERGTEMEGLTKAVPPSLTAAWRVLEKAMAPMLARLQAWGFETPRLSLRPALAVYAWATWGNWDTAVRLYGLDPGDMAMLVFRTADNLRQIANLAETHPGLAPTARAGVDLILKEPVTVPL